MARPMMNPDGTWDFECFLAVKFEPDNLYYNIKWAGCDETTWEPTEHMYDVREALYNFHSIYTVVSAMYLSPPDVAIVWGEDVQQINGWSFQDGVISFYTKRVDSKLFFWELADDLVGLEGFSGALQAFNHHYCIVGPQVLSALVGHDHDDGDEEDEPDDMELMVEVEVEPESEDDAPLEIDADDPNDEDYDPIHDDTMDYE